MTIVLTNSALQSFTFESTDVRIVDVDGEPWFVASDILKAIKSTTTVTSVNVIISDDLGDGYVSNIPIVDSMGRTQDAIILHESAVTLLISRSRTEMGKAFNRHLHAVILPTIRKTGKFIAHPEFDLSILDREADINQRYKASVLALREAKIEDNQRKLDRLKPLIVAVEFNKSIVAWADSHLVYCEGNKIRVGRDAQNQDSLSASYIGFCELKGLTALGFWCFSRELVRYLRGNKQWHIKRYREAKGAYLLNIAFSPSC